MDFLFNSRLDVSGNHLNEAQLAEEAFLGLDVLRRLLMNRNFFSRIPSTMMRGIALEELCMNTNRISRLESDDFDQLSGFIHINC
jgi:hypothetical protein